MNRGVKIIFWSVEIAFALISGVSEAIIYQAYSVDDWAGTVQAFMRAGGMQLMIVMFGFAAVQASKNGKSGLVWLANALALGFSFISFWFIRESAIAEAHLSLLQSAYNQPLSLAGITIGGQGLDPNLIGCIPFLQTALNWFAPVITQDTKVEYTETIEEMHERMERELIMQQHKQNKRALGARGAVGLIGTVTKAAVANVTGKDDSHAAITETPVPTDTSSVAASSVVASDIEAGGKAPTAAAPAVESTIHRLSEEYQEDVDGQNGHSRPNAMAASSGMLDSQPARVEGRRAVGAIGTIVGAPPPRNQRKSAASR